MNARCDRTGERYLRELIAMYATLKCPNVTELYRRVASAHNVSWHTPEKKIRRLIARTHKSGALFNLNNLLQLPVIDQYPPTVKNLLSLILIYIRICSESDSAAA